MRRLIAFEHVSLDGRFVDAAGDMRWAHRAPAAPEDDEEWNEFTRANASGGGALLFGRVTYEMMASFWPTPAAAQQMPEVAEAMNRSLKYVCSRTLHGADWINTTLIAGELTGFVQQLKKLPGPGIAILGSGSIVAQLASAGLIDEYQLVVNPIALGAGRTVFDGLAKPLALRLTESRRFRNGNVLLRYTS
jgi:dihydrofolate reductase